MLVASGPAPIMLARQYSFAKFKVWKMFDAIDISADAGGGIEDLAVATILDGSALPAIDALRLPRSFWHDLRSCKK